MSTSLWLIVWIQNVHTCCQNCPRTRFAASQLFSCLLTWQSFPSGRDILDANSTRFRLGLEWAWQNDRIKRHARKEYQAALYHYKQHFWTDLIKCKYKIFWRPYPGNVEVWHHHQVEHGKLHECLEPGQDSRHGEQEEDQQTTLPRAQGSIGHHLGREECPFPAVPVHIHHGDLRSRLEQLETTTMMLACSFVSCFLASGPSLDLKPIRGQEVHCQPIRGCKIHCQPIWEQEDL